MHNVFITQRMDWKPHFRSRAMKWANVILTRIWPHMRLVDVHGTGAMSDTEQRMNLFHLVRQVMVYGVPGDLVELGCYQGQTATLFGILIGEYGPERSLHVYDYFASEQQMQTVRKNFESVGARIPQMHRGRIQDTVPKELPDQICFAHIDVGSKGAGDVKALVRYCLESLYPRLSKGAVCVLQDYCDKSVLDSLDPWPGVKAAADEFFADKPESVSVLYAGYFSHGFVCKH
jgi:O-methyltransferase